MEITQQATVRNTSSCPLGALVKGVSGTAARGDNALGHHEGLDFWHQEATGRDEGHERIAQIVNAEDVRPRHRRLIHARPP